MTVTISIVARTNSTRLHRKVLKEVSGKRMIDWIIDNMKSVEAVDQVYLATSINENDRILAEIAEEKNIPALMGSELSVIDRMLQIAVKEGSRFIIRVTGDNIFTDPAILSVLIKKAVELDVDYARVEGAPIGVTGEVIKVSALKKCYKSLNPGHSEYLMLFMFNPSVFKTLVLDVSEWVPDFTTLTVDTPDDWERTLFISDKLNGLHGVSTQEIIELSERVELPNFYLHPEIEVKTPFEKPMTLKDYYAAQKRKSRQAQFFYKLSKSLDVHE